MTTKTRNRLILLFILAFPFIVLFGFIFSEYVAPLPPVQPLPNPNGYDDLVKAGKMVVVNATINTTFYGDMSETQLQEVVSTNAAALALARAGLSNQCRVPVQYSEIWSNHLDDLASLKHLAQAFLAEGRLAEMENRPSDAAKSYLDVIHSGNESARGGTLMDELVGMAIESIGTSPLQKLVPQLNAQFCRETAAALETLDSQRQTWNEVMQQEHDWSHRTFNSLQDKIHRPFLEKTAEKAYQKPAKKFKEQQVKTRQLIINLAARAYELDKGHPPASLADLVPDYLKAIPQDPFTGTNMIYSPK
ncbi:MAG TPA: hypothetical protein VHY30_09000 [Verrucomicrobiae bacterium]|nr:hypothetical protein [Verrucomicrobiae bacterium]